jgi:mono/diheme cytochrome c family protein
LQAGKLVYEQHCAACHGVNGNGNGSAAVWLFPKPRNFSAGLFKIQSTPAGSLPTDDDLLQTVTRGMAGSSMPSFTYLTDQQRRDVVQYVKHLTADMDASGKRVNKFEEAAAGGDHRKPVDVPPEPPATLQTLTRGKEMFTKLQCFTCHGETGAGDGPSAPTLKDNWGIPLPPRDFNTGAFRGGAAGRDLYLRINSGLAGTPMPPFGDDILKPEDRWALVQYIQSLRRKDIEVNDMLAPTDGNIHVARAKKVPTDPLDRSWERFDTVRVPLNPLWPEKDPIPAVAVHAMHDGKQVAILCQWRDPLLNGAPIRVQDFQDAIALQFSLSDATPFLGMGDAQNPVNLWQWKAGWQAEVESHRPDMHDRYVSMYVDIYPQAGPLYVTAEAAGNLISTPHKSPVEDANARGFGTLQSQPASSQNVNGKGVWHDGFWNVVFVRDLKSKDRGDVKFTVGKPTHVAFAVWDGENHDRNGRKVISNWYQLIFEQ